MQIEVYICSYITTRNIVACLQDVINKLAMVCPLWMTSTSSRDEKLDVLTTLNAPDILHKDDYPDVPYWHNLDWVGYSE